MTARHAFACAVLACLAGGAMAEETPRMPSVTLSFSPLALEALTGASEEVVVSLSYFVHPSPEGRARANESGEIGLGTYELRVPPVPGAVDLSGGRPQAVDAALVSAPPRVNVNVGSARLSAEDNVLNCDVFEGYLAALSAEDITLHCSMIDEARQNILVSGEPQLVGPEWAVTSIAGEDVVAGTPVTLQFVPGGRLAGSGGCNRLISSYTVDGAALEIAAIGTTRMACEEALMAQEARLTELLHRIDVYRFTPERELILEAEDGSWIVARDPSAR